MSIAAVAAPIPSDPRSAVLAVFDEYFWDGCLLEASRVKYLEQILAALTV